MSNAVVKRCTVKEYFELERKSVTKHEFFDGEIFAMAGASEAHNLISLNIAAELRNALRDRDCIALPSDMRVFVPCGLYIPILTQRSFVGRVTSKSTRD